MLGRIKQKRKGLILGTVEGSDTGVYQCEIEREWAAAHLIVSTALEQPKPPENLTCLPLSPTSIRVSWTQAPFLHPIQAFSVHFSPTDGGEEDNMPAALNTIEVSTLKPNTNYTFYVRSWGKKTASESSHKLICSTTDPDSLKWPRVSIRSIGTSCLFVEWSPPSSSSINVSYYQLQWKPANVSSVYFVTLPPYIHHYYITDLLPGGQYNVSVLSSVRADNVPWKSETLPQYIPNNPTTISVNLFNSTTVNVDWFDSSVSSNRLTLYYKKLPSGPEKQEFISSNLTRYVITQLESNSWYEVGLLPRGCASLVHTAIGSGGALSKPHSLTATSPSPSRLSVSWSRVSLATSYMLTLTQRANASANCVYNTEKTHVEVGDVKSGTLYELRVRALGPNGLSSPSSDNLLIRTMPSVAGGILNWRVINTTSVEITVRVTRYGQTQYSILYTKEPSAPGYAWQQRVVTSNNNLLILSGLTPGSTYVVRVAPLPMLGQNYSSDVNITLPLTGGSFGSNSGSSSSPKNTSDQNSDKILGILVGCAISACFIALCSMTVLYKRRCFKNQPALGASQENPSVPTPQSSEALSLTRLDTKSGYTNGPVNGVWRPLIGNGRVPNGHPYETTNLRITENPQYERRNEGDGGSRSTTDEGDSLLSGEEAGCADDSSCCLDKDLRSPDIHSTVQHCCTELHEKPHSDDGFHETINIISSL